MTSKKIDNKSSVAFSCAISYLLISFVSFLRIKTKIKHLPDKAIINSAIAIFIGIVLAFILGIIFTRKWFKNVMVKTIHKTPNDDIWRDVLDLENGSNLKVFLRDEPYYIIGKHKNHEENGEESWLALKAFAKMDKETNEYYKNEPKFLDDDNVIITVRFSDIEYIEIFN